MFENLEQVVRLVASAAAFALVGALWTALVVVWSIYRQGQQRTLHRRLGLLTPEQGPERTLRLWREGGVATTTVPGEFGATTWAMRLRRRHYQAGLGTEIGPVVAGVGGLMIILGAGAWVLTSNPIVTLAVPCFVALAYSAWLARRIRRRADLFERQFVHALELAARSLRAGHPLLGAFTLISEEMDEPVSTTFIEVIQQHAMGISIENALESVAAVSTSQDLRLFATSVAIQLRSGGNLADMMERLAFVIRDRLRLGRRIRVLTSQTQFSKRVLIGMPFVLFAILSAINPAYIATLYKTQAGAVLLGAGAIMMVLGIVAMNRLAVLKY